MKLPSILFMLVSVLLLNQDLAKCGRINLFGLTTKKSFSSRAPTWI